MEKRARKKGGPGAIRMLLRDRNSAALNTTWKNLGISRGDISRKLISPLLLSKGHGMCVRELRGGRWELN